MAEKSSRGKLAEIQDWPVRARIAGFRSATLAKHCGTNRKALERFFKRKFGTTPQMWLNSLRQQELESQLLQGKRLKEAAFSLGYKQPSHMSAQFSKAHGIPPSEWKRQNR